MTARLRYLIAILALLIIGLLWYVFYFSVQPKSLTAVPVVINVPLDQLPEYFPEGVFMAVDAHLINNTNSYFNNNIIWATRRYETALSTNQLQMDYNNYAASLGESWQRIDLPGSADRSSVVLKNGQVGLIITIISAKPKNIVELRFTKNAFIQ